MMYHDDMAHSGRAKTRRDLANLLISLDEEKNTQLYR